MQQRLIFNIYCNQRGRGGGVTRTPYDGLYGKAPTARGNFYRLQENERKGNFTP